MLRHQIQASIFPENLALLHHLARGVAVRSVFPGSSGTERDAGGVGYDG